MTRSICLNMIVRDEAAIIGETLRNLTEKVPLSSWTISDTGSVDATPQIIVDFFDRAGIPGKLVSHPWQGFSDNRNLALQACAGTSDYVLFFDADDYIRGAPDFRNLDADGYYLKYSDEAGSIAYERPWLVTNDGRARWRGAVHEFVDTKDMKLTALGGDYAIISRRLGARNKNRNKYLADAHALEMAFADDKDPDLAPRYAFYCANSYRDHGDTRRALEWYERRIEMDGWRDERFMSWLNIGLIHERNGKHDKALFAYISGHNTCPDRVECIYHASRMLRHAGRFASAYVFAKEGVSIPFPEGGRLFLSASIRDFWMSYEYLFLRGKLGKPVKDLPLYSEFIAGPAPADVKETLSGFR
ncbi:MAG: glycosyltransferase [Paracoccus sp. (in: a-proteobacteria)]|nr:glycosyltransferase [Paracoccus sp. (in: a-proteobacteria)]